LEYTRVLKPKEKELGKMHSALCTKPCPVKTAMIPEAAKLALPRFRIHTGKCLLFWFWMQGEELGKECHQLHLGKCHRAIRPPRIIS
jgi:hypothetical protein